MKLGDMSHVEDRVGDTPLRLVEKVIGDPGSDPSLLAVRPQRDRDQLSCRDDRFHPVRDIVAAADWTYTSRNPLIRFRKNYFWEDIALIVKRCTGLTVGVHKNYRLIE